MPIAAATSGSWGILKEPCAPIATAIRQPRVPGSRSATVGCRGGVPPPPASLSVSTMTTDAICSRAGPSAATCRLTFVYGQPVAYRTVQFRDNGFMGSDQADEQSDQLLDKAELLDAFHDTVAQWLASRAKVEQTANFGAAGGPGESQHKNAVAVHDVNTAKLRELLAVAGGRDDVDDVELSRAATISPLELGAIRRELGTTSSAKP